MDWLQTILNGVEGLTDEQKTAIIDGTKAEFPKHAVPKDQYSKKTAELEAANAQLTEAQASIEELSKNGENSDELKTKLADITKQFDDYKANSEKRESNREKKAALIKSLTDAGMLPSAAKLYANGYDLDKITLNANKEVVDSNLITDPLKTESKELFSTVTSDGNPPPKGDPPPTDYSKMSDEEYYATMKAKKEAAK